MSGAVRLALLGALALGACKREPPRRLGGEAHPVALGAPIHDPVTGETCPRGPGTEVAVYRERNFYFCRPESRIEFLSDVRRYAYE